MKEYIQKEYGDMVGKTITGVRALTEQEIKDMWWSSHCSEVAFVVTLSDGTFFVPIRDDEGNGPGALMRGDLRKP